VTTIPNLFSRSDYALAMPMLVLAAFAIATLGIGIFPEVFLRVVNWSLTLSQDTRMIGLLR
jgi:hypothetical protein